MVDGETRGCEARGGVVGAGGRRAGRPKGRTGHKAPKRPFGRLLLWPPPPPRLTSCRRCGKMLARGHTGGVRSAVHRPWCDKSPVVRNDRALLYLGDYQRDYRRIKCA